MNTECHEMIVRCMFFIVFSVVQVPHFLQFKVPSDLSLGSVSESSQVR